MDSKLINGALSSFDKLAAFIRRYKPEEILIGVSEAIKIPAEQLAAHPMGGYSKNEKSGAYWYVISDMKKNIVHYEWVYKHMADDKSREVFTNLMRFRIVPDIHFIKRAYDAAYPQYFDGEIIQTGENEVFVDCGGFTGDTVQSYIKHCEKYKHIYVFEPSSDNINKCRENLKMHSMQDIEIIQAGVGKKNDMLTLCGAKSSSSFSRSGGSTAGEQVRIVSLDEEISETVTFIKMDVESFEIDALLGAKQHIRKNSPKLAVCLYHIVSDIWEIPKLIHSINPNYKYYIRHYDENQNWETVLYAIPVSNAEIKKSIQPKEKLRVYALCPFVSKWTNQQLLKDCGLVPYMMHRVFGYDATMVGVRHGDYPYLEKYLSGMKMDFLPDCHDDSELLKHQLSYVYQNYKTMDVLILNGPYLVYQLLIPEYRKLRPDGKIYLGLDANSSWMDRLKWTTPEFSGLLDECDVIATSCRAMQRHLDKKWPRWKIEYVPNGFFNPTGREVLISPEDKENIILTVSRIGTAQKATHILLEAFARVHAEIPDWKIHLVGNIDNGFKPYIDKYFQQYPQLRERVLFKGLIESKEELFDEYRRAKIFILTSIYEGGSPNVVAEALHHGCYTITSSIDAASDITNNGALGKTFPIGDVGALADIFLEVCQNDGALSPIPDIVAYAKNTFDWDLIIKRMHHLLFEV